MKRLWLSAVAAAAISCGLSHAAKAQTAIVVGPGCNSSTVPIAQVGKLDWLRIDPATGNLCIAGTFTGSVSISGFQFTTRGVPVTMPSTANVTQSGEPATATWWVENVGAANAAYCRPDAVPATTADMYFAPGGGSKGLVTGGSTTISCISPGGGTTVNVTGGVGLPGGNTGGGAAGGGGGTVAQGAPAAVGNAWPHYLVEGGVAVGLGNGLPIIPATGAIFVLGAGGQTIGSIANASFGISGNLPAFASAPTVLLGAGGATIGAISNSSFGISGTLPAFASTPTFNLGSGTVTVLAAPLKYHLVALATTNSVSVKPSAGTVYSAQLGGIGAAPAYLKFYDKATAPTCNTDPVAKELIIPAAATAANGGGSNVSIPIGVAFTTGIGICVTNGIADNDNTAVSAATFIVNFDYQ